MYTLIRRILLELSAFIALGLAALFAFMQVWWLFALCIVTWYLLYGFVGMAYSACAKGKMAWSRFFINITVPYTLYPFRRANYYWLKAANIVSSRPASIDASRHALEITGRVDVDGLMTDNNKASYFTFLAALHLDLGNLALVRTYLDKVRELPHKSILDDEIRRLDGILTSVTIRLARHDDAQVIADIHIRSWEEAYKDIVPPAYIRETNANRHELWNTLLSGENTMHFVIQKCGSIVGLLGMGPPRDDNLGDDFYELFSIYLHPDYFRQGIGSQALELAYKVARSLWKTYIVVWGFAENKGTIMFYEKCGFTADGEERKMDCGRTLVCIRMRRRL